MRGRPWLGEDKLYDPEVAAAAATAPSTQPWHLAARRRWCQHASENNHHHGQGGVGEQSRWTSFSSFAPSANPRHHRTYATGARDGGSGDENRNSDDDDAVNATDKSSRAAAAAAAVEETLSGANPSAFEVTETDRAKSQILRFLNYKPRTRAELMTKLVAGSVSLVQLVNTNFSPRSAPS